ncbi:UNVERIFIED_CONTAM: hypothetical protein NCL1_53686 [Trichonephila clavipes]
MNSPRNRKLRTACSLFECSMRSDTNLLSTVKMYRFPASSSRRLLCNEKIGKQILNLCFVMCISLQFDGLNSPDDWVSTQIRVNKIHINL